MSCAVRYHFIQKFSIPAKRAYEWCTDYSSEDFSLIKNSNGKRKIEKIAAGVIILIDTFQTQNGTVKKKKLIHLYPAQLQWVSTHLSGLNKYSQFVYSISEDENCTSFLDFNALHYEYEKENLDAFQIKLLTDKLCREDSNIWRLFAKAMDKELAK
ncbi:MAG: hypothetical protein GX638_02305 [Crenarchaeota archaeon]|nr:hypothetical protein [Thermoproteota archaeon]